MGGTVLTIRWNRSDPLANARICARLALKTRQALGVVREDVREHLDGHLSPELCIGGPIHLPHPALADSSSHLIRAEAGAKS